jgi:hypothetical protein
MGPVETARDAADTYAVDLGLAPVPLYGQSKSDYGQQKRPVGDDWRNYVYSPENWPNVAQAVGIICGARSRNLLVFDFEEESAWFKCQPLFTTELFPGGFCWIAHTGRGVHVFIFAEFPVKPLGGKSLVQGLRFEIRGDGQQVVAPPSVLRHVEPVSEAHPTGLDVVYRRTFLHEVKTLPNVLPASRLESLIRDVLSTLGEEKARHYRLVHDEAKGCLLHTMSPAKAHSFQPSAAESAPALLEEPRDLQAAEEVFFRHWPTTGNRHYYAMAIGGSLVRSNVPPEDGIRLMEGLLLRLRSEGKDPNLPESKLAELLRCVKDTYRRFADGDKNITGLPALCKIIEETTGSEDTAAEAVSEISRALRPPKPWEMPNVVAPPSGSYTINDTGVWFTSGKTPYLVCPVPLWVEGRGRDLDQPEEMFLLVAWLRRDGKTVRFAYPSSHLRNQSKLMNHACRLGPVISSSNSKAMTALFQSLDAESHRLPRFQRTSRNGWVSSDCRAFVMGDDTFGTLDEWVMPELSMERQAAFSKPSLSRLKTLEDWKKGFGPLMYEHTEFRFLCGCVAVAPMLRFLDQSSTPLVTYLGIQSTKSKTMSARWALSIFGDPDRMILDFTGSATFVGIETFLAEFQDCACAIDNIHILENAERAPIQPGDLAYLLGEGKGRSRGMMDKGEIVAAPTKRWVNSVIAISESTAFTAVATKLGASFRFLPINKEPFGDRLFSPQEIASLHRLADGARGEVARRIIQSLVDMTDEDREALRMKIRSDAERLISKLDELTVHGISMATRLASAYAFVALGIDKLRDILDYKDIPDGITTVLPFFLSRVMDLGARGDDATRALRHALSLPSFKPHLFYSGGGFEVYQGIKANSGVLGMLPGTYMGVPRKLCNAAAVPGICFYKATLEADLRDSKYDAPTFLSEGVNRGWFIAEKDSAEVFPKCAPKGCKGRVSRGTQCVIINTANPTVREMLALGADLDELMEQDTEDNSE